ncbi:S16 family serine protease [Variovorax humicola]|uniref:S16 family serine protease n=1 Tax=Variovorax humicola TaxID=1769758 RepID=A0ABU8W9W6_9BURK
MRGPVLPVGGLKEKVLAAQRAGVHTVLLPARNLKELREVPDSVRAALRIVGVSTVDDAVRHALTGIDEFKPEAVSG